MDRTPCTQPQCLYCTAIPLLPLLAVQPVHNLIACTKVHFTFTLPYLCTITHYVDQLKQSICCNYAGRLKHVQLEHQHIIPTVLTSLMSEPLKAKTGASHVCLTTCSTVHVNCIVIYVLLTV